MPSQAERMQDKLAAKRKAAKSKPKKTMTGVQAEMSARNAKNKPTAKPAIKLESPKKEESKKQTFKEAFAANRKAGKKTFSWNGKEYTTNVKEETKKPAAKAKAPAKAKKTTSKPSKRKVDSRFMY